MTAFRASQYHSHYCKKLDVYRDIISYPNVFDISFVFFLSKAQSRIKSSLSEQ